MSLAVDLLNFVNELTFELPVHIVSFEDHSGTMRANFLTILGLKSPIP